MSPVRIRKLKSGKVRVSTPSGVKAKRTTIAKAGKQAKIINAAHHGIKFKTRRK